MCAFIAEKRLVQYDDSKFIMLDGRQYSLLPIYNILLMQHYSVSSARPAQQLKWNSSGWNVLQRESNIDSREIEFTGGMKETAYIYLCVCVCVCVCVSVCAFSYVCVYDMHNSALNLYECVSVGVFTWKFTFHLASDLQTK